MSQRSVMQFVYRRHPDQERTEGKAAHHPVIIVGAGPVGLSLAIDLAQRGQAIVLLDDTDRIGDGSRAICFSKRSLELWDRLGVGERMVEKGIVWKVGKIFLKDEMIYRFDLLPEDGHKMPAFINLQQYYVEAYLVDRIQELPLIDLRWRNKVVGLEQHNDHAIIEIETPDGRYKLSSDFVIACDGAISFARFRGRGISRRILQRSIFDRRRKDDGCVSNRTLVLVRPSISFRPVRAASPSARRRVAHRSATWRRRGSRR